MDQGLYTIILDFRSGTYLSQVEASDEREAMRRWAGLIADQRHAGRSSSHLAKAFLRGLDDENRPTPIEGLVGVWCVTAICGASLAIANVVASSPERLRIRKRDPLITGELGDDVIADLQNAEYGASPR